MQLDFPYSDLRLVVAVKVSYQAKVPSCIQMILAMALVSSYLYFRDTDSLLEAKAEIYQERTLWSDGQDLFSSQ